MRRRTQLMRESGSKNKDDDEITSIRRNYLHIRTQILQQKYGPLDSSLTNSSRRTSKANSKAPSIDSQSLNLDWRDTQSNTKRMYNYVNSNVATALAAAPNQNKYSSIYSSKESLNSVNNNNNNSSHASSMGGGGASGGALTSKSKLNTFTSATNIDEQYSFAGVHHIFDNHRGAGIKIILSFLKINFQFLFIFLLKKSDTC
jgi:hypothetical protein